jgi:hypothetical protein
MTKELILIFNGNLMISNMLLVNNIIFFFYYFLFTLITLVNSFAKCFYSSENPAIKGEENVSIGAEWRFAVLLRLRKTSNSALR